MLKEERIRIIMREINLRNKVLSTDLAIILNVSDDTVRRDLKFLADNGDILKVHGGAISKSFIPSFYSNDNVYAKDFKKEIASKTLKLFKNDMVVLTEGGTTIIELAKMIPDNLRMTFFTISPRVAITLSEHSNLNVITIGGKLNKNANIHVGAGVVNELIDLKVDLCLLGVNALSIEDGLTDIDWDVVQVQKTLIRCSKKVAVLSISEKLNTVQRIKICDINKLDYLITELSPQSPFLFQYQKKMVNLM